MGFDKPLQDVVAAVSYLFDWSSQRGLFREDTKSTRQLTRATGISRCIRKTCSASSPVKAIVLQLCQKGFSDPLHDPHPDSAFARESRGASYSPSQFGGVEC